ncbi:MAG TPA: metal-dependent hydrolase [Clostridiales bacterium]|nr:metal-dependent hydrolase [Clostridiales bacterium]
MIIDFHAHTFPPKIAAPVLQKLQRLSRSRPFTDGTADGLRRSMEHAGVDVSVLLPVMTNTGQVRKLNEAAARTNEHWRETGLLSFGGMHPDTPNIREELSHAQQLGLRGIKLHPAYQGTDFDDIRYLRIIDRACELGLIVLTHAGWDIGMPEHNFCSVRHVQRVMREVSPDKLVLAHMGGWHDWEAVEQELAGLPLYFDTAFSTGDILPAPGTTRTPEESHNLRQAQFVRLVRRHGADRVLFATDSPWSDQAETLHFVRTAGFSEAELNALLGGNAQKLLGI